MVLPKLGPVSSGSCSLHASKVHQEEAPVRCASFQNDVVGVQVPAQPGAVSSASAPVQESLQVQLAPDAARRSSCWWMCLHLG